MKTYADIQAEIAKLEKQAQAVLNQERAGVISRIKEAIQVYGFTARELGLGADSKVPSKRNSASKPKAASTATTVGVAKYRDPQTGKTWTGRGKPPNWIVGAKDREVFLIRPGTDVRPPAA
jgi:DNA-binding protein H-NS